ncbi:MAG: 23S rRNA (adenine(2030)-N(6))-methyltransferase RlmJ [Betaproteobacteria bacterium]|nr:23S rRNA (adenine(2030)-N(6))-methyltransferase RlmJ [Betaproteobacteria bacterium]MCC6247080.1 23S rRNA (adenine(2030)-N(6))-methyltransferase RlmJ [Rubrivivax sp.]MCL4695998.1 23S rRNA (adenine(2030)-N(6))-methyltransferase RlmJ [Burkholderiaceae bacterium]
MLAYRHAFHAGNHADVLKHVVLAELLRYLNEKDKGWRYVDTHAGAGGYALGGTYAQKHREYEAGIGRLYERDAAAAALPAAVARYVELVRAFNDGGALRQVPGSPAIARALMRPQDQLRLFELHPTEHKILASYLGEEAGCEVRLADGYGALKSVLPPPTRRGLVLIDPPYELKTDYAKALNAMREALTRFPEGVVMVWLPQVQLVEAAQLPQRLKASAEAQAKKGWLHARLTVAEAGERGFGLMGSSVFIANPPHTLHGTLQPVLPFLARELAQFEGAKGFVEKSVAA